MVAHMSRLSLSAKKGHLSGKEEIARWEDDDDDDDEWEDEAEDDHRPLQIGISPELQCALRGNEILPEKLLSNMKPQNKSGMELVLWRPPGTVVPPEIMASITSSSSSSSSSSASSSKVAASPPPKNSLPPLGGDTRDNAVGAKTPKTELLTLSRDLPALARNHDLTKNDMDMDTA